MLIFQWCFHPTSALLGLSRVDPCAVLLHRQRCYLHLTPCLFDWVAHVFSLPLVDNWVGGGAGFSYTIQPGARTFEDKKWGSWKKTRNRPPRAAEPLSLLSYESSLAGSQKKNKANKRKALRAHAWRLIRAGGVVARIRRPCCCSLCFGVALMRRTRVGTPGGQGWHGKHQSAGKISLKPQLGNLGSVD